MTEYEICSLAVAGVLALGLYLIIGIGIFAISGYYDYEILFVVLWPVALVIVLIKQLIEFIKDEIIDPIRWR